MKAIFIERDLGSKCRIKKFLIVTKLAFYPVEIPIYLIQKKQWKRKERQTVFGIVIQIPDKQSFRLDDWCDI